MPCRQTNNPSMAANSDDLEMVTSLLQQAHSHKDRLLVLLSSMDDPCKVRDLRATAISAGFRRARTLNISDVLTKAAPHAVNLADGWAITRSGRDYLSQKGLAAKPVDPRNWAPNLRDSLARFADGQTASFIHEAFRCHEYGLNRAAIVMSWVGAVSLLQHHIVEHHLDEFNEIAIQKNTNWRLAKTANDVGRMRESDFLNRLTELSVIGRDVKNELMQCLKRRNSCGHPNDFVVGRRTTAHYLEVLMNNIFNGPCALCSEG